MRFILGVCFVIWCFFNPKFAFCDDQTYTCNTSSLSISNATYSANQSIYHLDSVSVTCNSGYQNPERKNVFFVKCKSGSFLKDSTSVCNPNSSPPKSANAVKFKCSLSNIKILKGTPYYYGTNTVYNEDYLSSGDSITIKCNKGYGYGYGNADGTSYVNSQSFDVLCADGQWSNFGSCLPLCDVSALQTELTALGQTADKTGVIAPGGGVTITCNTGGIQELGSSSYKLGCKAKYNCSSGSCRLESYFSNANSICGSSSVSTASNISVKTTNCTDSTIAYSDLPNYLPKCVSLYQYCNTKTLTDSISGNSNPSSVSLGNDGNGQIQDPSDTYNRRNGDYIKITCKYPISTRVLTSQSTSIANQYSNYTWSGVTTTGIADQKNFDGTDSTGRPFRIFICQNGSWSPDPSTFFCPTQTCALSGNCGITEN